MNIHPKPKPRLLSIDTHVLAIAAAQGYSRREVEIAALYFKPTGVPDSSGNIGHSLAEESFKLWHARGGLWNELGGEYPKEGHQKTDALDRGRLEFDAFEILEDLFLIVSPEGKILYVRECFPAIGVLNLLKRIAGNQLARQPEEQKK